MSNHTLITFTLLAHWPHWGRLSHHKRGDPKKIITGQAVRSSFWLQEKMWKPVHFFRSLTLVSPCGTTFNINTPMVETELLWKIETEFLAVLALRSPSFLSFRKTDTNESPLLFPFLRRLLGPDWMQREKKGRGGLSNNFSVGPRTLSFSALSAPCRRVEVWWHVSWKNIFIIFKFPRKWIIWSITTTTFRSAVQASALGVNVKSKPMS